MDNGYSLSDIASIMGNNGGSGGLLMVVILFLFVVFMGRGGLGGNQGYQPQYATQQDVQNTAQYGNLLDGNRDLGNLVTSGTAQAVAATNQAKYDNINVMKDVQMALSGQIADVKSMEQNILGNQNECCCSTKMLIAESTANTNARIEAAKYETAMQMAGMEQRITAKMDQDKIEALQAQVNQLQLAQATSGMLRFPNSWSYGAGPFPPIFGGCNCQNAI